MSEIDKQAEETALKAVRAIKHGVQSDNDYGFWDMPEERLAAITSNAIGLPALLSSLTALRAENEELTVKLASAERNCNFSKALVVQLESRISSLEKVAEAARKIKCPRCGGEKVVAALPIKFLCSSGAVETRSCPECNGTGEHPAIAAAASSLASARTENQTVASRLANADLDLGALLSRISSLEKVVAHSDERLALALKEREELETLFKSQVVVESSIVPSAGMGEGEGKGNHGA